MHEGSFGLFLTNRGVQETWVHRNPSGYEITFWGEEHFDDGKGKNPFMEYSTFPEGFVTVKKIESLKARKANFD
jgi:hypothetical protein